MHSHNIISFTYSANVLNFRSNHFISIAFHIDKVDFLKETRAIEPCSVVTIFWNGKSHFIKENLIMLCNLIFEIWRSVKDVEKISPITLFIFHPHPQTLLSIFLSNYLISDEGCVEESKGKLNFREIYRSKFLEFLSSGWLKINSIFMPGCCSDEGLKVKFHLNI
jgi:hypothetical protein